MSRSVTLLAAPLLAGAVLSALPSAASAQFTKEEVKAAQKDPGKFTLDENSVAIERLGPVAEPADVPGGGGDSGGLDPTVVLDQIVNIGKKVWAIIDANKPVVDIKTQYATALPQGVTSAAQLAGWKPPRGVIYGLSAKNAYGAKVIDVKWEVLRTYGGRYKGHGQFLSGVTIQPLQVDVLWGYKFSLDATVGDTSITNAGTDEEPIAALQPTIQWRVQTAIKDSTGRAGYYLQGDGQMSELGSAFSNALRLSVEDALKRTGAAR